MFLHSLGTMGEMHKLPHPDPSDPLVLARAKERPSHRLDWFIDANMKMFSGFMADAGCGGDAQSTLPEVCA